MKIRSTDLFMIGILLVGIIILLVKDAPTFIQGVFGPF